jgi:SAM-dependent methyltransferase
MTDKTQEKCRACHKALHTYPMGEKNGYSLAACRSCGTVTVTPWVTDKDREEYFGEVEPQVTHIQAHEKEIIRLQKLIQQRIPDPKGKRFLDIGAQYGYAAIAARNLGMSVTAIEPHEFFIQFLQEKYENPEIFLHTTLQEYAATKPEAADFIYSSENFCMQTDPESFTAALASLLTPGGKLYIDEPDGNSFNLPRKFTSWEMAFPPINFIYFSKRGMAALLARHGLKIKRKFFTWRPFMRLVVIKK